MIAHVAASGEDRGRVILQMGHGRLSTPTLEAALTVAKAFDASIECLFVEDQQLYDMANLPFTREISSCGRTITTADPDTLALDFRCDAIAAQREVTARTASTGVPQAGRVMRDTHVDALARACAEHGPWNVIALTDATTQVATQDGDKSLLYAALTDVSDHTGVVVAATTKGLARPTTGPIAVLIETIDDLHVLLRIAEKLSAVDRHSQPDIVLMLATDRFDDAYAGLEAQTRLALSASIDLTTEHQSGHQSGHQSEHAQTDPSDDAPVVRRMPKIQLVPGHAATLRAIHTLRPSFFVAHFGCNFFPPDSDPAERVAVLSCPSFIVR
jgi:hypothetical protein